MRKKIKKLSVQEAAKWQSVIRELIKQENGLINERLGWLIQIQGLLFAALAFSWEKAPKALTIVIAMLGIATAISLYSVLRMYSVAIRRLHDWWINYRRPELIEGPDIIGLWAPSSGLWWWLRPWRFLPVLFVVAWMSVLLILFCTGTGAKIGG